jgi:hypothetical protein
MPSGGSGCVSHNGDRPILPCRHAVVQLRLIYYGKSADIDSLLLGLCLGYSVNETAYAERW